MIKIYSKTNFQLLEDDIYILDIPEGSLCNGDYIRSLAPEEGSMVWHQVVWDRGKETELKSFCKMTPEKFKEFLGAALIAAKENHLEIPTESHIAGKLEATTRHLEDMRSLLKLK